MNEDLLRRITNGIIDLDGEIQPESTKLGDDSSAIFLTPLHLLGSGTCAYEQIGTIEYDDYILRHTRRFNSDGVLESEWYEYSSKSALGHWIEQVEHSDDYGAEPLP